MKFSSRTIFLAGVGLFFVVALMNGCMSYNRMVGLDETSTNQWNQVENVYQRRMDLIPNIVAVCKKYANFEKETLEGLVSARAKATQITIDPSKLDETSIRKFEEAQGAISSSLGRLLAISENYPDLKSSSKFDALITELEGSENRIARERQVFNETVKDYNMYIRKFPSKIWASMFGFEKKAAFEMKKGADETPDVEKLMED